MWHVVRTYLWALPGIYNSTELEYYRSISENVQDDTPRWKECFNMMSSSFDMTLGLLYVNVNLNYDSKKTVSYNLAHEK
jgi:predicted metalloendopeptidase